MHDAIYDVKLYVKSILRTRNSPDLNVRALGESLKHAQAYRPALNNEALHKGNNFLCHLRRIQMLEMIVLTTFYSDELMFIVTLMIIFIII